MQLRQSGAFDGAVAIALGDFVKCDPPADAGYTLLDVLREALEPLDVPVWFGLPIGHGSTNLAWRVGAPAEIGPGGFVQDNPIAAV